jgi:hypothetical protein
MVGHITAELFLGARMSRYFSTSWAATVNSGMKTAKTFDALQDASARATKIAAELGQDGDQYRGFASPSPMKTTMKSCGFPSN